jgi:peptidoglycan/LPS O-acetylase OafA/YrhL
MSNHSEFKNSTIGHVLAYDGIKGLSCLLIMLVHFRFTTFNFPAILPYIALHAFFVLSAFLITKNLLVDKQRFSSFQTYFKRFYIKRTLRIFPVYYFYIFLIAAITILLILIHKSLPILNNEWKNFGWMQMVFLSNFREFIAIFKGYDNYYTTAPVFVHLWSVSLEEQFYLFIVFTVFFISKETLKKMCIIAIVTFPFIRIVGYYLLLNYSKDELATTLVVAHTPIFQFDVFFYGILPNVVDLKKFKNVYKWLLISLAFLIIWALGSSLYISIKEQISFFETIRLDKYIYRNFGIFFIDSIANFCVLCVVLVATWYPEKIKFFTTKFWVLIGVPSYSVYIFQFFFLIISFLFMFLLRKIFPIYIAEIIGCILFLISTVFFATLSYKYIEIPMFKLKDKFLKKII